MEDPTDLLEYLYDAEYVVYVLHSKHIVISYLHTSIITTASVDAGMELRLQAVRSRKIGSLRIIKASVLEGSLVRELPTALRRRWLSRPK